MIKLFTKFFAWTILSWSFASISYGYTPAEQRPKLAHETPEEIKDVGVTERAGKSIDLDLQFTDDEGQLVTLGNYFNQSKPVLMAMVYYECPSLCNYQMNGLTDVFRKMKLKAGTDYEFVAVSMNHREKPALANMKKDNHIKALGRTEEAKGWHLLTGSEDNISALSEQLGFKFKWNESLQQYAHAAATYVLTPAGLISRYIYGIEFDPQTMRFALLESAKGMIGTVIDQIVLFCFQFDPSKNKYTLYAFNLMRLGALLVLILLAIFLIPFWLKEKRQSGKA